MRANNAHAPDRTKITGEKRKMSAAGDGQRYPAKFWLGV